MVQQKVPPWELLKTEVVPGSSPHGGEVVVKMFKGYKATCLAQGSSQLCMTPHHGKGTQPGRKHTIEYFVNRRKEEITKLRRGRHAELEVTASI
eukprot:1158554-Pelagomonas_calceolata.AAC.10